MRDTVIVTGGDALYFPLMSELIDSIRDGFGAAGPAIGVIDAGLGPEQVAALRDRGVTVRTLDPVLPAMERHLKRRPALAVNFAKLWLDRIFPGYRTIVSLDADTWVQDGTAIGTLVSGAASGALAIVGTGAWCRDQLVNIRWVLGIFPQIRSFYYKNAAHARIPWSKRRRLAAATELNAGVFALAASAPHWERLRHWQAYILRHGKPFTSDQLAIGLACHVDGLACELLPPACNYYSRFRVDPASGRIVEFYAPHQPVGIVHMPGQKTVRFDPEARIPIPGTDGRLYNVNPRYGHLRRTLAQEAR